MAKPMGNPALRYTKTGLSRNQIGLTDQEIADARKISIAPSQSFSNAAPRDMCLVDISEPSGDLGDKACTCGKDLT